MRIHWALSALILASALLMATARAESLSESVDQAIFSILKTPTGQSALCPFTETPALVDLYIGVSQNREQQVQSICGRRFITPISRQAVYAMSSRVLRPDPNYPGKRFESLGLRPDMRDIQSFTNKGNVTFFLMAPEEMTGPEFIRTLAHEYAMSYDQLNRIGYLVDGTKWEQGLNSAFGRPLYTADTIFENDHDVHEISCALRDPGVRYALATERAFRFEDRVIAELGLQSVSPAKASRDFWTAIRRYSGLYSKFAKVIEWEASKYQVVCGPLAQGAARRQQIMKRARLLDATVLTYLGTNKTLRMSDLVLQPHVGPLMPDLDGGGPRPRAGGWGDGE